MDKYLIDCKVIGDDGDYPEFENRYQTARYGQGPGARATPQESCEMSCREILEAAQVFN